MHKAPSFSASSMNVFSGVSVGTSVVFLCLGTVGYRFLGECMENQPWTIEEEKQLHEMPTGAFRRLNEINAFSVNP